MTPIEVTFIRHAESTYNKYGDLSKDVGITSEGKAMCNNIDGEYDVVICSVLRRARETLLNSRIKCTNIIYTHLCREIRDGNTSNLLENERENISETPAGVENRIQELFTLIRELHNGISSRYNGKSPRIAVVCHGIFLSKIIGGLFHNCEKRIHILH